MSARASSVILLLIGLVVNLAGGWPAQQEDPPAVSGFYTEPQLIELLTKVFAWPAYEKLVFITASGQVFTFGSGEEKRVTIDLLDIIETLSRKGESLGTATNIIHNHTRGVDFSLPDIATCGALRKRGFTGAFQLFYPQTRRIKTLKRRNYARA